MAVENENILMVVDGELGEEDFTADAAAEALEEAFEAGAAPKVLLAGTHMLALEFCNLADLQLHAID